MANNDHFGLIYKSTSNSIKLVFKDVLDLKDILYFGLANGE